MKVLCIHDAETDVEDEEEEEERHQRLLGDINNYWTKI